MTTKPLTNTTITQLAAMPVTTQNDVREAIDTILEAYFHVRVDEDWELDPLARALVTLDDVFNDGDNFRYFLKWSE